MNLNSEQGMRIDMDVELMEAPHARVMSDEQARELVLRVVAQHADSLLRTARRHSLCADDAQDAYQRTMEIFVRRAATLDAERAHKWVHTVCKHEAMAVRAQRQQLVSSEEPDLDREEARHVPSPEERMVSYDRLRRSAEALQRLKPQELRALWLKAEGFSYAEICEQTGWTHTKVNRCISEGRRAFLARYARIDSGGECERWLPLLSAIVDGEATPEQLLEIRPHLRNCTACRATVRELHATSAPLAALLPVALAPAAADHGHERAAGLFVRLYEAISGGIHERAASAAFKLQAAAESASTGKLAAIAASAAALAGGGAVVATSATPATHQRAARAHSAATAAVAPTAPGPSAAVPPGHATAISAPGQRKPRAPQAQRAHRHEFTVPVTTPRTEFTSASTASAAAPAPAPSVVRAGSPEPSASSREFASEFGG
jgi:RNA polymerase sigma factor (sigma-70 family)